MILLLPLFIILISAIDLIRKINTKELNCDIEKIINACDDRIIAVKVNVNFVRYSFGNLYHPRDNCTMLYNLYEKQGKIPCYWYDGRFVGSPMLSVSNDIIVIILMVVIMILFMIVIYENKKHQ